jgi:hypothetical protein
MFESGRESLTCWGQLCSFRLVHALISELDWHVWACKHTLVTHHALVRFHNRRCNYGDSAHLGLSVLKAVCDVLARHGRPPC